MAINGYSDFRQSLLICACPNELIEWTPLGHEQGRRFIDEVRALRPKHEWIDEELAFLKSFGIYVGLIEATRRDRTMAAVRPFIESRNLIVVSTSASKHRRYRLFTARSFDGFLDYIEGEQDGRKWLISESAVAKTNRDRHVRRRGKTLLIKDIQKFVNPY